MDFASSVGPTFVSSPNMCMQTFASVPAPLTAPVRTRTVYIPVGTAFPHLSVCLCFVSTQLSQGKDHSFFGTDPNSETLTL